MLRKLKEYKIEVASIAVILLNTVIIKKDLKKIREMKQRPKMVIFK